MDAINLGQQIVGNFALCVQKDQVAAFPEFTPMRKTTMTKQSNNLPII